MLKLNDWAKLIGQKCLHRNDIETITGVELYEDGSFNVNITRSYSYCETPDSDHPIKPILRRIEHVDSRELIIFINKYRVYVDIAYIEQEEDVEEVYYHILDNLLDEEKVSFYDYLDSIGIDQRGWIDKGLAIDAKTLEG